MQCHPAAHSSSAQSQQARLDHPDKIVRQLREVEASQIQNAQRIRF